MTKSIKFGKFEGNQSQGEDREADIFVNGVRVGTITGVVADFGGILESVYAIESYMVDVDEAHLSDGFDFDFEVFRVRNRHGELIQSASAAKRAAKAWILEASR